MGAFQNDKTLGRGEILTDVIGLRTEFIVWEQLAVFREMQIPGNEEYGPTTKTVLLVSKMDEPENKFEAGVIGASGDKMAELTDDELPCVCQLVEFHSKQYDRDGTIVQWVRDLPAEQADALAESID